MTVFGLVTRKVNFNERFENRYFIQADNPTLAAQLGVNIIQAEMLVFGAAVLTQNVHVWRVGVSPNQYLNNGIVIPGQIPTSDAIDPQICVRFFFNRANTYPNYKDYRVCVDSTQIAGREWTGDVLAAIPGLLTFFAARIADQSIVARDGTPFVSVSASPLVHFRNVTKRWYNKASSQI